MKKLLFFSCGALLMLSSCNRWKLPDTDNLDATEDMALAENLFADGFKQVGDAANITEDSLNKSTFETLSGCGTLTIAPLDLTFPKTLTLDFGASNCTGSDGRNRRGVIVATITDWWQSPGCTLTVNYNGYHVDDYQVAGTKTIVNLGPNTNGNFEYSVNFPNCVITKPNNGGVITWQTTRLHEWIAGSSTPLNPADDQYSISGQINGVSSQNVTFAAQTGTNLDLLVGCKWIRGGTMNVDIETFPTITINYGDGTCDNNAVATIGGSNYPFVMN